MCLGHVVVADCATKATWPSTSFNHLKFENFVFGN